MAGSDPIKFNQLTDLSLIEFLNFYAIEIERRRNMINRLRGKKSFEEYVMAALNELLD